jgi:hypothetical protein
MRGAPPLNEVDGVLNSLCSKLSAVVGGPNRNIICIEGDPDILRDNRGHAIDIENEKEWRENTTLREPLLESLGRAEVTIKVDPGCPV